MRVWLSRYCLILVALITSGCSLLEVKIENNTTPLTQRELATRLLTREYALTFFSQVEQSADTLALQYADDDRYHQSYVLLWKINAQQGLQRSAYQASPQAGLIDSWVFTAQMANYFEQGKGAELFEPNLALESSQQLLANIDQLASQLMNRSLYNSSKTFVEQFAIEHPFDDIRFATTPAYRAWLENQGMSADEAASSVGTMAEAMADVSDRLSLVSEQTPKIIGWKAELVALHSDFTSADLVTAVDSFKATSESFQDFIENNPEYMRHLATSMATELQPLVNDIDAKTSAQLDKVSAERIALELLVERERNELIALVERERLALEVIVTNQRQMLTQELDQVSQDVLALALEKLVILVKQTVVYLVLFVLVIFFAPLMLGYALGRRSGGRREKAGS